MAFDLNPFSPLIEIGGKLLDKLIPDPLARDAAKLELLKQNQSGALDEVKISISAILSESQSTDPWTSRARPSFMYVMYILMLSSIPMGILFAFKPDIAAAVTVGFKAWLSSIPDSYLTLFGVGYLGYTGARTYEKAKGITQ